MVTPLDQAQMIAGTPSASTSFRAASIAGVGSVFESSAIRRVMIGPPKTSSAAAFTWSIARRAASRWNSPYSAPDPVNGAIWPIGTCSGAFCPQTDRGRTALSVIAPPAAPAVCMNLRRPGFFDLISDMLHLPVRFDLRLCSRDSGDRQYNFYTGPAHHG